MPRKERVQYEGAIYHVMDRGNRGEAIYRDDEDRKLFLKTVGEACQKTGWRIHAYVLMGNHYHILLETPEANLSVGMQWLQATYTIRHNARHKLRGHLFAGRYKAIPVDGEERGYFQTLSDYIHLNPVRAGVLSEGETLESYPWSSYPQLLRSKEERPAWLVGEWVLGGHGGEDTAHGRRNYQIAMEDRIRSERDGGAIEPTTLEQLRKGWVFGTAAFRERLLKILSEKQRESGNAERAKSHDESEAMRLIEVGLREFGLSKEELIKLPKGSLLKIALAVQIKRTTVMNNQWIAKVLAMGVPSRVSRYCSEAGSREEIQELLQKLEMSKCKA